jgi:predicted enzyme related to lactoylglutathione lyase
LDESCIRIGELGGRILTEKREVPDMGWYVFVEDPEGNRFAIWQNMV